ncbi:Zn-dependent hydrolase [Aquibacillus albus]|uniref:Allantoate deiminase n=1 Tax=Aquibacillus albus TaxID=1168171 RepID=A0ABS2MW92_9BACI|nr:Zn-dependent hydrolase [Aquibacillus albus]MBM7570121.1 allantoate deiminase [Aquibacillus albus]
MHINEERLWNRINELGEIGRSENGGLNRFSFTDEERQAKELIKKYMAEAGLSVREDEIGNVFGKMDGKNPNGKTVLIGSHIDTVLNGGKFDGAVGVLSGIEVLQTLNEKGITTENPLEVVAFTDEEGARFSTGLLGSEAYIGDLTYNDLADNTDNNGISIAEAMINQGYDPTNLASVKADANSIKCYLEVHIEQGKVLESKNVPVGLVTGIAGLRWLKIKINGEAGHAGTTPMALRKDPLAAAVEIIHRVEQLAKEQEQTVMTVGQFIVNPGGINVIPSNVEFTIDIRDLSEALLDQLVTQINNMTHNICAKREVTLEVENLHSVSGVDCSAEVYQSIQTTIEDKGIEVVKLPSGAIHDAMVIGKITDIGMIFLRTKDGISHTSEEWCEKEDVSMGAQVLLGSVIKLAANSFVQHG